MRKLGKQRNIYPNQPFEENFEQVYSRYFKPLFLYARSIAKSDEIAKDVVSEVFFSLWKSNTDLNQIREIESYLFRSVKNQVIRTLSSDPKNFSTLETENHVKQIEMVSPEEVLLEKELVSIIDEAIEKLPDQCRLVFDMAKNQQMNYASIGKELGISLSTIKTQVSRALATIKQAIESQYTSGRDQRTGTARD